MSITDAIYRGIKSKFEDAGKSVHFAVGDYNPVQMDESYTPITPPHSPHSIIWGGDSYNFSNYQWIEKEYPVASEIAARALFKKDVEKTAFLLGLDSSDLARIFNMQRITSSRPSSGSKKLAKQGTKNAINYFVSRQFNTQRDVGGMFTDNLIKDTKPVTKISAQVYLYKYTL